MKKLLLLSTLITLNACSEDENMSLFEQASGPQYLQVLTSENSQLMPDQYRSRLECEKAGFNIFLYTYNGKPNSWSGEYDGGKFRCIPAPKQ